MSVPIDRDNSGITNDELCRGVLVLTIEASDNGTPKLADTATVWRKFYNIKQFGYSFMLRSPNQRANQIRRSYKNEEFDWLFDFVTVT